jgi:hypothetical protein
VRTEIWLADARVTVDAGAELGGEPGRAAGLRWAGRRSLELSRMDVLQYQIASGRHETLALAA